jgi:DNA polymerase III delta prime subunit
VKGRQPLCNWPRAPAIQENQPSAAKGVGSGGEARNGKLEADDPSRAFIAWIDISYTPSMAHLRILLIDGLPGSGKSTTAAAVGHRLPCSRVFLESHAGHPLLVGVPDERGAAFADIHQSHSAETFAVAALEKLDGFLASAESGTTYIFESHPIQSTARVLLQLDAPEVTMLKFWSELQDRLDSTEPLLVYFQENDPKQAFIEIIRARGAAWELYVVDAFNRYPWMKARGLSGVGGILEMIGQYSALSDRLVALWRFPVLRLAARPESYKERTDALIEWLARKG